MSREGGKKEVSMILSCVLVIKIKLLIRIAGIYLKFYNYAQN